eukprot:4277922-Pleurochrysis_carterae.AAC.1
MPGVCTTVNLLMNTVIRHQTRRKRPIKYILCIGLRTLRHQESQHRPSDLEACSFPCNPYYQANLVSMK